MARTKRLSSHKASKAPKLKIRVHRHGNITKRLHGRKRAANINHRRKVVAWDPGVHKAKRHGVASKIAGHHKSAHPATRHPGVKHRAGTHPKVAGHKRGRAIHATLTTRHHKAETAAARSKISARLKGRHHPGHKGSHHKGHKLSATTRSKIAARLRGHKHPHRSTRRKRR